MGLISVVKNVVLPDFDNRYRFTAHQIVLPTREISYNFDRKINALMHVHVDVDLLGVEKRGNFIAHAVAELDVLGRVVEYSLWNLGETNQRFENFVKFLGIEKPRRTRFFMLNDLLGCYLPNQNTEIQLAYESEKEKKENEKIVFLDNYR